MWGGLYDLNYYFKVLEYSDWTVLNLAWIPYQLIIHISKRRISQLVPFHNLGTVLSFWSKDPWMFLNIILEYVSSVLTHLCSVSILFLIKHRNCWFGTKIESDEVWISSQKICCLCLQMSRVTHENRSYGGRDKQLPLALLRRQTWAGEDHCLPTCWTWIQNLQTRRFCDEMVPATWLPELSWPLHKRGQGLHCKM